MMMMTVVIVMMMVTMMMTIIMMINDDHDHNHQENDFHDDDDNDNEMMIRALTVTWVNCGKVGGLYCSMVQYCNVMKIKHNITFLISFSSPQKAHQV